MEKNKNELTIPDIKRLLDFYAQEFFERGFTKKGFKKANEFREDLKKDFWGFFNKELQDSTKEYVVLRYQMDFGKLPQNFPTVLMDEYIESRFKINFNKWYNKNKAVDYNKKNRTPAQNFWHYSFIILLVIFATIAVIFHYIWIVFIFFLACICGLMI